jgi:hypothetical protein
MNIIQDIVIKIGLSGLIVIGIKAVIDIIKNLVFIIYKRFYTRIIKLDSNPFNTKELNSETWLKLGKKYGFDQEKDLAEYKSDSKELFIVKDGKLFM